MEEQIDLLERLLLKANYPAVYLDAIKAGKVDDGSESTLLIKCGEFERVCMPDNASKLRALNHLIDKIEEIKKIKIR